MCVCVRVCVCVCVCVDKGMKSEVKVAQSYTTLSDSMDCSPPGSSVHGIFQARVLEWGAIAFSMENPQEIQYNEKVSDHPRQAQDGEVESPELFPPYPACQKFFPDL